MFILISASHKIVAKASYRSYNHFLQVDDTTQALASAAMAMLPLLPLLKTATLDSEAIGALAPAFDTAAREVFAGRIIALVRTSESAQQRLTNRKTNLGGLANRG